MTVFVCFLATLLAYCRQEELETRNCFYPLNPFPNQCSTPPPPTPQHFNFPRFSAAISTWEKSLGWIEGKAVEKRGPALMRSLAASENKTTPTSF